MTTTKDIAGLAVGLGSMSLVANAGKMFKDSMSSKPSSKKMVRGMVDLTIGTALLSPMSEAVNKL